MDPEKFLRIIDLLAAELQRPASGGLRSLGAIGGASHVDCALALRVGIASWIDAGMRGEMLQKALETANTSQTLLFTFTDQATFAKFQSIEGGTPEKAEALRSAITLSQLEVRKIDQLEKLGDFAQFCLSNYANRLEYWSLVEKRLGLGLNTHAPQGGKTGCMAVVAVFVTLAWFAYLMLP